MIDASDIRPGHSVTRGAMTDRLDLVVHSPHGPVGGSKTGPGQDTVVVSPEHPRGVPEGLQPAVAGALEPLVQACRDGAVHPQERGQPEV